MSAKTRSTLKIKKTKFNKCTSKVLQWMWKKTWNNLSLFSRDTRIVDELYNSFHQERLWDICIAWVHYWMTDMFYGGVFFTWLDKPLRLFLRIYRKSTKSECPFYRYEGDCLGLEPNLSQPPPLICGPVPLLARNHPTVKQAFSNLPKTHREDLLLCQKKEQKKNTHLCDYLVGWERTSKVNTAITHTSLVNVVKYDSRFCCSLKMSDGGWEGWEIPFKDPFLFKWCFPRGYNMAGFVTLSQHFQ